MVVKKNIVAQICVLLDALKRLQAWSLVILWVTNYLFLKNFATSVGAVSQDVEYYQQLSIAHHQLSFYVEMHFE